MTIQAMSGQRTQTQGDELLLAHLQVLSLEDRTAKPPQSRVDDRLGPALAGLLLRALGRRGQARSARRL